MKRSSGRVVAAIVFGLALAGTASCKREEPSPGAPASASTVATATRPRAKAYSNPPEQEVGTLPAGVGLTVGGAAPDATLLDANGQRVNLRELASHGALLLVFYRGGWCPFCNFQIHELTTAFPEFQRRGVTPVAISVDRVEETAKTRATYAIPFPVLSDQDLLAHRAFRVVRHVDDAELSRLNGMGLDLEAASGRDHHMIAIPAIFILDQAGVIRWAHANVDYKVRPSAEQLLQAIDQVLR
ncbi:MAG: peroxiredoxin-like family protein [bacterium]